MKRGLMAGAVGIVIVLLALAAGYRALLRTFDSATVASPSGKAPSGLTEVEMHESFLYGRVSTVEGSTYEGRLRWGNGEEAFWGNYFNGVRKANPWVSHVPPEQLPKERQPIGIFGIEIAQREKPLDLGRSFMVRFGDIARIEARGRDVRVILKSGKGFDLDRFSASDFDDGVRVWDAKNGVVDLDSLRIRAIDLLPAPQTGGVPNRLHGTVRTRHGDFTGFVQWHREESTGTDELEGQAAEGEVRLRFDTIRSIARRSNESALVTQMDGREMLLSGTSDVGRGNRGVYVDDPRYGRVLVSWDAFQRVDFSPGGSGPAYGDFPPGGAITGSITIRGGRRLSGRIVYDLDESEIAETLDAPAQGVNYNLPFGLVASVVLAGRENRGDKLVRVVLHSGEEFELERSGDLGDGNAGMLVFSNAGERPQYVRWTDVQQIDLERPAAMYPPLSQP